MFCLNLRLEYFSTFPSEDAITLKTNVASSIVKRTFLAISIRVVRSAAVPVAVLNSSRNAAACVFEPVGHRWVGRSWRRNRAAPTRASNVDNVIVGSYKTNAVTRNENKQL